MASRETPAQERRAEQPIVTREMMIRADTVNEEARTVDVVWSTGAPVRRRDWWSGTTFIETLNLDPSAVRLDRLNSGGAPVLPNHDAWDVDDQLGVVVAGSAKVDGAEATATLRFVSQGIDEDADRLFAKVKDGIINRVSVGYVVHVWNEVRQEGVLISREAADWEPYEISFVSIPADPQAGVRSEGRMFACTIRALPTQKEDDMSKTVETPAGEGKPDVRNETGNDKDPVTGAKPPAAAANDTPEQRVAAFQRIGRAFSASAEDTLAAMVAHRSAEAWRDHLIEQRAAADQETHTSSIVVTRDAQEMATRGMEDALVAQLSGQAVSDNGRRFMDLRSIVDFAAERLGERRVPGGFGQREQLLQRAFHTTSDFPLLMENALNRSLAARYALAQPTYRRIARQRSYQDFRDHSTVRVGDFPTLQPVSADGGEVKSGTFGEAREKTSVKAYGVTVSLSRQLLVNDGLGGITQVLNDRGSAVARFEDKTFYAMMLSAAGAGPTLAETGRAVFNTTDVTLAAANAAISVASVSLGRAAIGKKKSVDGEELELNPSILLVGPDKLTEAEQLVANITAQQSSNVNVFSGKLEVISTAKITGNAWYIFVDPSVLANFEWGLLDGYTAPRFRIEDVFGRQGTQLSLEHDFGCGAIDYRGGYRNAGA